MAMFSGIIKCTQCNKNFNFKDNNGTHEYVCQTRKNKGIETCNSTVLKEEELFELIEAHCEFYNKEFGKSKVKLFVNKIEVDKIGYIIYFKDGNKIECTENYVSLT